MDDSHTKQSFWSHLEAMRRTLLACVCVLILSTLGSICLLPWVSDLLIWPLHKGISLANLSDTTAPKGLITTRPMGVFSILIQISLLTGLALSLPVNLWLMGRFLAPGLRAHEKRWLLPSALAIMALFFVGASVSYFVLLPASLAVSISLNELLGFEVIWSASDYYSLVVWMTLALGLSFEFPVVLTALCYLELIRLDTLRQMRRVAFVCFLIVAALINPSGDPVSLFLIGGLMHGLYEAAITLSARLLSKKHQEQALEDAGLSSC